MAARADLRGHGAAHGGDPRRHPHRRARQPLHASRGPVPARQRQAGRRGPAAAHHGAGPHLVGPGGGAHHADARAGVLAERHARGRLGVAQHPGRRDAARAAATGYGRDHDGLPNPLGNGLFGTGGCRTLQPLAHHGHGQRRLREALGGAGVRPRRAGERGRGLDPGGRARRRPRGPRRLPGGRAHRAAGGGAHRGERQDGRRRPRRPRARRRRRRGRAPRRVLQRHGRARRDHRDVPAPLRRRRGARDRHAAHGAPGRPRTGRAQGHERRRAPARGPGARPDRASRDALRQPAPALAPRGGRARRRRAAEHRPRRRSSRAGRRRGLARRAGGHRARHRREPEARCPSPWSGRGCRPSSPTCSTTR